MRGLKKGQKIRKGGAIRNLKLTSGPAGSEVLQKGWPKELPCLGWCDKMRLSRHAGDRFCSECKEKKEDMAW